jgi:3-oxoacyl-[acyl-carrier protein] reductase
MDLNGKKVVVTGGVSGLGRSMVDNLVSGGAAVTVFDLNAQEFDKLKQAHATVHCVECDVSDYDQVLKATADYHEKFGAADIVINNAGILYSSPVLKISAGGIEKHDVAMWNKVLRTDLSSVFYVTVCFVEKMIATRTRGVIVNISSVASSGIPGASAYSAAKAGVNALTASWAKELGPLGIRVIAIAPGFADTESTHAATGARALADTVSKVPLRRLAKPDEIAAGVVSAIQNDFFNGKVFELDGGLVL